jgi:hypothetical protein
MAIAPNVFTAIHACRKRDGKKSLAKELLQAMMFPSNDVFVAVVRARNVDNVDTGTLIRTFVSLYAKERGIELEWPEGVGRNSGKGRIKARPAQKFKDALRQAPYPVDD